MLNQFRFIISWDDAIEKFYEYVISHCIDFFDVPNKDIIFSIIPNTDTKSFCMVVRADESVDTSEQINLSDLPFTDNKYKRITFGTSSINSAKIIDGQICLSRCEIRFIKLDKQKVIGEIGKMLHSMVKAYFKSKWCELELKLDSEKDIFFCNGTYKSKKIINRKGEITDLTQEVQRFPYNL